MNLEIIARFFRIESKDILIKVFGTDDLTEIFATNTDKDVTIKIEDYVRKKYDRQLTKEANERIKQSQAEQSKVVAKAQSYYAR